MGFSGILFKVSSFMLLLEYVRAQETYDETGRDTWGHLQKIPRKFEVRSENALLDFKRYIHDIQDLIAGKNLTVLYKVRVEVLDTHQHINKKKMNKKFRSKKYNIPLKKQSMKLSTFEALLRRLAEENGQKLAHHEEKSAVSTPKENLEITTKQIQIKYKPYRRIKTNFTKIIKPVRNKIITLIA